MHHKPCKAFTLLEILMVILLISILASIVYIAVNPAKSFLDTRNTQRGADVTQILNAVTQYTSQQGHLLSDLGNIPLCSSTSAMIIRGNGAPGPNQVNLETLLVDTYIVGIPKDPIEGSGAATGYTICRTNDSRVQVSAPKTEGGLNPITVKR